MNILRPAVAALIAAIAGAAHADLTIGISLPLTGPASGLGIPMNNYIALWPQTPPAFANRSVDNSFGPPTD